MARVVEARRGLADIAVGAELGAAVVAMDAGLGGRDALVAAVAGEEGGHFGGEDDTG